MSRPLESLHAIMQKYVENTGKVHAQEYAFNKAQRELAFLLIQVIFTHHPDSTQSPESYMYYEIVFHLIHALAFLSEKFCKELAKVCAVGKKIHREVDPKILEMIKGAILQNNLELLEIGGTALRHQLHQEKLNLKYSMKDEKLSDVVDRVSLRLN